MKKLLLSGLVFAAMSSGALAAQPLTEQQMDGVTAGARVLGPYLLVRTTARIDSITGVTTTANTETYSILIGPDGLPTINGLPTITSIDSITGVTARADAETYSISIVSDGSRTISLR